MKNHKTKKLMMRSFTVMVEAVVLFAVFSSPAYCQYDDGNQRFSAADIRLALDRIRATTISWYDANDLLEGLFFRHFERPQLRTRIALIHKTVATLEREARFRTRGNAAVHDNNVERMLTWLDAIAGDVAIWSMQPPLIPHRIFIPHEAIVKGTTPPLFGFLDRATATRSSLRFGDQDLLACLGFRTLGWSPEKPLAIAPEHERIARARQVGLQVIYIINGSATTDAAIGTLCLREINLHQAVQPDQTESSKNSTTQVNLIVALRDPPNGESWGGSIARRSLARTLSGNGVAHILAWHPPQLPTGESPLVDAMWLHSLMGQRVAMLTGWRDSRDGLADAVPSTFTNPARIETISLTAMHLLLSGVDISWEKQAHTLKSDIALVVDSSAVQSTVRNTWSPWAEKLFNQLLARQISFDVYPANANFAQLKRDYRFVIQLDPETADQVATLAETALINARDERLRVVLSTGAEASNVWCNPVALTDNSRVCYVVANLSEVARNLSLKDAKHQGVYVDLLTGEPISDPAAGSLFMPGQVRVLLGQ